VCGHEFKPQYHQKKKFFLRKKEKRKEGKEKEKKPFFFHPKVHILYEQTLDNHPISVHHFSLSLLAGSSFSNF
jgi:hypothetical protein